MGINVMLLNPPYFPQFSKNSRSPAVSKGGCVYYPIWLGYAAGSLEINGHTTKLVDATAPKEMMSVEQMVSIAREFNPRLLIMHTVTSSVVNDGKVAAAIKAALPDCKIAMVGPHVSAVSENTLTISPAVDMVMRKEYDLISVEVANHIENGKPLDAVQGITFRNAKNEIVKNPERAFIPNLDDLPLPAQVRRGRGEAGGRLAHQHQ